MIQSPDGTVREPMPAENGHQPVLLRQTLELLTPKPGDVVVDCTVGRGGHAAALADTIGSAGHMVIIDRDPENLHHAADRLADAGHEVTTIHDSFATVAQHMALLGLQADVVLADLGVSSTHLDDPARGFSFQHDGPLDMRLDPQASQTASDLVNQMDERSLANLIFEYGEEPFSRRIARKLVLARHEEPIRTTGRLAQLVQEAYGSRARSSRMHPATRTFMALRIAVNDELNALQTLLEQVTRGAALAMAAPNGSDVQDARERPAGQGWLAPGARIGVISFHSLEDRLVKRAFVELGRRGLATILTRKPVIADEDERQMNPRARSAKMRVVRLHDTDDIQPPRSD